MKKMLSILMAILTIIVTFSSFQAVQVSADAKKLIAITFDDGPSKHTETLLDALKQYGAKATFFTVGSRIASYTSTVKREVAEGHEVAGHSYSHAKLSTLSYEDAKREMDSGIATISQYTNYKTYLIRPPYGSKNDTVKSVGYPLILWSVDTLDWKSKNADSVYQNIMSMTKDGSIILLHDLYETSVQGAIRAIPELQAQGYEFVTVSELFRRRGITLEGGGVYTHAEPTGKDLPALTAPAITESDKDGQKTVTMSVNASGFAIYYTVDGSAPTAASTPYTAAITISKPTTFKAIAIDSFGTKSPVSEKKIVANACKNVTFTVNSSGSLELATETEGAQIFYTTDLTEPTSSSTLYTGAFLPSGSVRAVAMKSGLYNSPIMTLYRTKYGDFFLDVPTNQWYSDIVAEVYHNGMFSGTGANYFSPNGSLTRAMFVMLLANISGDNLDAYSSAGAIFPDVAEGEWYAKAVAWAADKGIAAGYDTGKFGPSDFISREQLCVMLARYMSVKKLSAVGELTNPAQFEDDAKISGWAKEAVNTCHALGLVNGVGGNFFNPSGTASRAESAAVLLSFTGKQSSGAIGSIKPEDTAPTSADAASNSGALITVLKIVAIAILAFIFLFLLMVAYFRIRTARRRARRRSMRARVNYRGDTNKGNHTDGSGSIHHSTSRGA